MALPASGSISLSQVNTELGYSSSAQISFSDSAVRELFDDTTGDISISDGYGKSNVFNLIISSNQTNVSLNSFAVSSGWNGTQPLSVTINSGVYVSSNSTATPALTVSGSYPNGVSIINNGYIIGMGGAGGTGQYNGSNGSAGGGALSVSSVVTFTNNGTIGGGGGGGGGGQGKANQDNDYIYGNGGGGGGGQSGLTNSLGGSSGSRSLLPGESQYSGNSGNSGTSSSAGAGGSGGGDSYGWVRGGSGGAGGSWGVSGSNGNTGSCTLNCVPSRDASATSGGAGGYAVSGNSNITWITTGTRLGSVL